MSQEIADPYSFVEITKTTYLGTDQAGVIDLMR